jgi:hypothetical protein
VLHTILLTQIIGLIIGLLIAVVVNNYRKNVKNNIAYCIQKRNRDERQDHNWKLQRNQDNSLLSFDTEKEASDWVSAVFVYSGGHSFRIVQLEKTYFAVAPDNELESQFVRVGSVIRRFDN